MKHSNASQTIATLDARLDCEQIVRLLTTVVFPWDIERSLEFALFRTYAVPSISGLLAVTGEFVKQTQKRYDDTELLLAEVIESGMESERGQQAIERINAMHGRYTISNDDYLYVLSTFVFEPIRWLEKYAWRTLTHHEQEAWFNYYQKLGSRMKIQNLPESIAEFENFNVKYEADNFVFAESNVVIGNVTRDLFLSFYLPKSLYNLGKPIVYSMLSTELRSAFAYPKPNIFTQWITHGALRARAVTQRFFPKNTRVSTIAGRKLPSYPMGYAIKDLGTFKKSS